MDFEYKILNRINSPADVKNSSRADLYKLAEEMRHALIQKASVCGGHLGSNPRHGGNHNCYALCV